MRKDICIDEAETDKYVKDVNTKLSKYFKKTDKLFAKWREENVTSCTDISREKEGASKEVDVPAIYFPKEDQFPINKVAFQMCGQP